MIGVEAPFICFFNKYNAVEFSEHLPHIIFGGMEANDRQARHVALVYEAD